MTVQLLEDTPPVLSLGQSCEEHRYSLESIEGPKLHLFKNCKKYHAIRKTTSPQSYLVYPVTLRVPVRPLCPYHLQHRIQRERARRKVRYTRGKIQDNGLPHGKALCVMGYRRKNTTLYAELRCMICPDGYASSPKIVRMEKLQR